MPPTPEGMQNSLPKIFTANEGSRKRFGSEFHVDGPATANARPPLAPPDEHARTSGDAAMCQITGWRRGVVVSGVRRINEVNARRARLVPGWVTVFGRVYHLGM